MSITVAARAAHDMPLLQQAGEVARAEAGNSSPQTDVGPVRLLPLDRDEPLQHRGNRQLCPLKQELPLQKRAVERS
jgi:hypothetical protein